MQASRATKHRGTTFEAPQVARPLPRRRYGNHHHPTKPGANLDASREKLYNADQARSSPATDRVYACAEVTNNGFRHSERIHDVIHKHVIPNTRPLPHKNLILPQRTTRIN